MKTTLVLSMVLTLLTGGGQALAQSQAGSEAAAPKTKPRAERKSRLPRRPQVTLGLLVAEASETKESERALRGLSTTVARRTSVEMEEGRPPRFGLLDPQLHAHPLVFLSGSEAMAEWSEDEVDAVRTYLTLGGMIVVDDRSGETDSEFARSARSELSRATGGRRFEVLPAEHSVFRSYYLLDRAWGRVETSTALESIILDGRAAVIFSPNDLLGALARDEFGNWSRPVHPGGRAQRERARRLGVNIVLYALTLDYKEDLVHLPHILERRR